LLIERIEFAQRGNVSQFATKEHDIALKRAITGNRLVKKSSEAWVLDLEIVEPLAEGMQRVKWNLLSKASRCICRCSAGGVDDFRHWLFLVSVELEPLASRLTLRDRGFYFQDTNEKQPFYEEQCKSEKFSMNLL
jgi:hypothetical protein